MSVLKSLTGCALILAFVTTQVRAELITPTTATASSEFAPAINLINGSGLDIIGRHDNDENHMWQTFAGTSVGESVVFEFDQVYDLSSALLWQYNGPSAGADPIDVPQREVEDFDISISPDLVSPFVSLGTNTLAPALDPLGGPIPTFNEPLQAFALAGNNLAKRVKITILSVYTGASDGFAGLSEVRFEGVAIPEPTTIGLAVMGALSISLGLVRHRRNRT